MWHLLTEQSLRRGQGVGRGHLDVRNYPYALPVRTRHRVERLSGRQQDFKVIVYAGFKCGMGLAGRRLTHDRRAFERLKVVRQFLGCRKRMG